MAEPVAQVATHKEDAMNYAFLYKFAHGRCFTFLDRMIHEHGDTSNAQVMNNECV